MGSPHEILSLRQYDAAHGSHSHEHHQVLLGLSGVLELEVCGQGRRISPGEGWIIGPGERHDFESQGGARCLVLDTTDLAWAQCPVHPAQPGVARALAPYLDASMQQGNPRVQQLASTLLLDCWRPRWVRPARAQRSIDWAALWRWAMAHCDEILTVADLAAQVCLSPSQFALRCRQATGQSPMQWLRQLRLRQAEGLRLGGLSVAQTAKRCGYRSSSALTAAMRRQERST